MYCSILLFVFASEGCKASLFCAVHQPLSEVRVLGPCQLCARLGQRLDLSTVCPLMPVSCCMKLYNFDAVYVRFYVM